MGTLWERAQCADAQLLVFQEEMARRSEQNCEHVYHGSFYIIVGADSVYRPSRTLAGVNPDRPQIPA